MRFYMNIQYNILVFELAHLVSFDGLDGGGCNVRGSQDIFRYQ